MEGKDNPVIKELQKEVAALKQQGYEEVAMSYPTENGGFDTYIVGGEGFGYENELMKNYVGISKVSTPQREFVQISSDFEPQAALPKDSPLFQKRIIPVDVDGCGSKGKGYVPWGAQNRLPNFIFQTAYSLPYIARSLSYTRDTIVGLGCEFMYRFTRYSGGTVTTKMIPYKDAGVLIRHRIMELMQQLSDGDNGEGEATVNFSSFTLNSKKETAPKPGTLEFELQLLQKDYEVWEKVNAEVTEFCKINSISKHMTKCMTDFVPLEMYFPIISLEVGLPGEEWKPKISKISSIDCVATRVEEMDDEHEINYVYHSDVWRGYGGYELLLPKSDQIVAYAALPENNPLEVLRDIVHKKRNNGVRSRPLHFCIPRRMPSMNSLYYTQPTWFSVYTSKLYDYAFTMISDRAAAKLNGTMFGKLIFVNKDYMESLMAANGCKTKEERLAFRKKFKDNIDQFLKDRRNNGATAMFDTFVSPNGELWDSIKIVDVPLNADNVTANKTELTEISNAIFLTMGLHSAVIGNDISASGSSGGTVHRELDLLKQKQLSPMQKDYLDFLNFIRDFNDWDPEHGEWVSKQMSLTTLDASKTGTTTITGDGQKLNT